MGLLTNFKAATANALPAVVVGRARSLPASNILSQLTGLNRYGMTGFNALELAPAENTALLREAFKDNHYGFIVINWVAKHFAKPPALLYEVKDQKALSRYSSLEPYQKADSYTLRRKAIAEIEDANDPLFHLLKQPNPYQTWSELAYEIAVYWTFGNALLYGVRIDKGPNRGQIRELYCLPTAYYAGKNAGIAGYEFYQDSLGVAPAIPGVDVLHLRRLNPDAENQQQRLWGMAKFTPARRLLAKSNNAIDAEAEAMQNRGPRTIIFPKNTEYSDDTSAGVKDATEALRKKLKQAGTGGIGGINVEVGKIEVGMSPVDLNIVKSTEVSKEDYCALMDVNVISVFSSMSGATFANKLEADKSSIRSGVLPDLTLLSGKLNQWLVPSYNLTNRYERYVDFNTDVFPELQPEKSEQLAWMRLMGSSINERREAMGYERDPDPTCDIKLAPQGDSPVTDFGAPAIDEPVKNDGSY